MPRLLIAMMAAVLAGSAPAADDAPKKSKPTAPDSKEQTQPTKTKAPLIGHMVFFKLKESTPETRQRLVNACEKYLRDHEGVAFFAAGPIGESFNRDVNDRDWDVALHLVFASKAAHDKYQDHPQHLQFIDENKETWAGVRVFDSEITTGPGRGAMKPGVKPAAGEKNPNPKKPAINNPEKKPAAKPTEKAPDKKPVDKSSEKPPVKKPVDKVSEKAPVKKPVDNPADKKAPEKKPGDKASEKAPVKKPVDKASEKAPVKKPVDKNPGK